MLCYCKYGTYAVSIGDTQLYKFNFCAALLYYLYAEPAYLNILVKLRETLVVCKYVASQCLVFVRFWNVEPELFVYTLNFEPAR